MRVFVSSKVPRGQKDLEQTAQVVVQALQQAGVSMFVAYREIAAQGLDDPQDFMPFVRHELAGCQLLLLLYHPELRGGLIELGIAYALDLPVWLLHPAGIQVSSSALGCAERVLAYTSLADLSTRLQDWLAAERPAEIRYPLRLCRIRLAQPDWQIRLKELR